MRPPFRLELALAALVAVVPLACTVDEDRPDGGSQVVRDGGNKPDGGDTTPDGGDTTPDGGSAKEDNDTLCSNGISDDGNNFADCDDFSCRLGVDVTVCPGVPAIQTVTIEQIQKEPHALTATNRNDPTKVTKVEVQDVVVTSPMFLTSGNPSFFVATPGATASAWNGVFVYAPGFSDDVVPGDRVTLKGTYEEFNGGSQVAAQRIAKNGTTTSPAPHALVAADLATPEASEAWESVLVRIDNVQVTAISQATGGTSGPSDDFEVTFPGTSTKVFVGALLLAQNDREMPAAGQLYGSITGILHYTYSKFRIQPRGKEDLVKAAANPDDRDNDGDLNDADNCPDTFNPNQENGDGDAFGDACDKCPSVSSEANVDADGDGKGDVCDNCPAAANADQKDTDGDEAGDVCDDDLDGDTKPNATDNCPLIPNEDQADEDGDGKGDVCDSPAGSRPPAAGEFIINEVLADPEGGNPDCTQDKVGTTVSGNTQCTQQLADENHRGDSNGDGTRDGTGDEFIEFVNSASDALVLDGVEIWTRNSQNTATNPAKRYTFPASTSIAAGKAIVVFGGGPAVGTFGGSQVLSAATGARPSSALGLANGGDKVQVKLADGTVIAEFEYSGTTGSQNQSMTRSPDVTGAHVQHKTVNANLNQSPGTKVDGSSF